MICNISGYRFIPLTHLEKWQLYFRELTASLQLKGSIVLSPEGINIMLAGPQNKIDAWISTIEKNPEWAGLEFKLSYSQTIPFKRLLIKIKPCLVPGAVNPLKEPAPNISPEDLNQWYQEGRKFTIIDTRNNYEVEVGHFKNALNIHLHEFKDFPEKIKALASDIKENPVVVYCTGGIRCEKAAPLALKAGFKNVYQLEGGILKYFETCGAEFFEGHCFVFDERRMIDSSLSEIMT